MPNDNIITSGSKFNIEEKYGVSSLLEGSGKFHSFKEIKFFMKDVSFNERKSVEVQKVISKRNGKVSSLSGGNRVIYVCSDKNCNFFVKWLRKKNSKEEFYIVDEKPHSELCSSTPKPTIKQLAKLPASKSSSFTTKEIFTYQAPCDENHTAEGAENSCKHFRTSINIFIPNHRASSVAVSQV